MLDPDKLAPMVEDALGRLLVHLGEDPGALAPDLAGRAARYGRVKGERGRAAVAEALGVEEAELAEVDRAVRDVERTFSRRDGSPQGERNATIAGVRLLTWMETLGRNVPALAPPAEVEAAVSEDLGSKQVRALELVVRSLITESYPDQEALLARLRGALSEKVVARWQASADPGDILSGCTFGELASLFVDKEEFARYERLYEDTPFLTLLKQRRKTLQAFLDDVRRVRNRIAHNKKVTNAQLTLLDLYYEEVVGPVQTAHDEGETTVDPSAYLEVGREELDGWFRGLHEDVVAVKDDLQELRASLAAGLGAVREDTAAIRETARGIDRKVVGIAAGVVVLIGLGLFLALQGGGTKEAAQAARAAGEETVATVSRVADEVAQAADASVRTAEAAEETAAAARESAASVEESAAATTEAAARTEAAAARTEDAARSVEETTERVAQTLEELRDGFQALVKQGGVIPDPTRPQEYYHNARVLERRGDVGPALQNYRAYFGFDELEFVDPHLRFQSFLKLQNGPAGAREVYYDLKKDAGSPVFDFAWNLLLEGEARVEGLEAFLEAHPDFAPAWYALSRDFSVARLGTQGLEDKRREKAALERFLALEAEGDFLRYYLDQQEAVEQVEDARERMAALASVPESVLENPVSASGLRSNQGWSVTLSIADTVKEIFYRLGTEGAFRSTGFVPGVRNHAGLPLANPAVQLPLDAPRTTIQVKYRDPRDREHGPYEVTFDPEAMLLESTKGILDATRMAWLSFRDYDGKTLLYFTYLVSNRDALEEIRYGLDRETPDRAFPLVPADPAAPHRFGTIDMPLLEVPGTTRFAVVQVVYKDGTESEIVRFGR